MAPELKDIKMGQLTTAVKELNELLFEPGDKNRIKTVGVSKGVLVSKLKEATAALDSAEGDKVTQATAATLQLLEIEIPEGVPVIGVEGEKEEKKKTSQKKETKKSGTGTKKAILKGGGTDQKSRYGHVMGSQAAKLDDLLFEGATVEEAAEIAKCSKSRVSVHIRHLIEKRGLKIEKTEQGVYKVAN